MATGHIISWYPRLNPTTPFSGGRIKDTDVLSLSEAASMASKHAGTEVSPLDFVRAAGRGEILLRALVHVKTVMEPQRLGEPVLHIPAGSIPTLPLTACQHLANAGRASWRHIDGHEATPDSYGELWRYERHRLPDDAADIDTTLEDCRVTGHDMHALADEFRLSAARVSEAKKIADAELYADFSEFVNNGDLIDWDYWAAQMPTWTAAQASRLLQGLDPDIYDDLKSKPTSNDVTGGTKKAMQAERLALALGVTSDTPENWLTWARARNIDVHVGLLLALRKCALAQSSADDEATPTEAMEPQRGGDNAGAEPNMDQEPGKTPALRAQEALILGWLDKAGYTRLSLPPSKAGKPGVKADVKLALRKHDLFKNKTTAFNKAWERLLGEDAIGYRREHN